MVDAQEQPQEQLLPAVVDDNLMGENHGGQQDLTIALTGTLDIDNDNEPVPENIPAPPPPHSLYTLYGLGSLQVLLWEIQQSNRHTGW